MEETIKNLRLVPKDPDFLNRKVGLSGEIQFDRTANTLRLYDGSADGGISLAKSDLSNVSNADFLAKSTAAGAGGGGGNTSVTVSSTVPTTASDGNLWFDTNTGTLFLYYDDGNSEQWVQPSSVIGNSGVVGEGNVTVGAISPLTPATGDLWLNTNNGILYVYYSDGDSGQWIQPSVPVPDVPSGLATVAISGSYNDLTNKPTIFDGAFSSLTGTPTTIAGYGITDAFSGDYNDLTNVPETGDSIGNLTISESTISTTDASIEFDSPVIIGSLTIPTDGLSINALKDVDTATSAPSPGDSLVWNGTNWVPGAGSGGGGEATNADTLDGLDSLYFLNYNNQTNKPFINTGTSLTSTSGSGTLFGDLVTFTQSSDKITSITSATGTVVHDFSTGAVFYHSNISSDFTANFTNVPTTDDRSIGIILILDQGATPYLPTAIQIGGVSQVIRWSGGVVPTGTSTFIDIVNFNLFRIGSAWTVIGNLFTYD